MPAWLLHTIINLSLALLCRPCNRIHKDQLNIFKINVTLFNLIFIAALSYDLKILDKTVTDRKSITHSLARMPIQAPQWTDFLTCPVCLYDFDDDRRLPLSLGCGHSICEVCINNLSGKLCPFDQASISEFVKDLVPNVALLQLLNLNWQKFSDKIPATVTAEHHADYKASSSCIEAVAVYLKPLSKG